MKFDSKAHMAIESAEVEKNITIQEQIASFDVAKLKAQIRYKHDNLANILPDKLKDERDLIVFKVIEYASHPNHGFYTRHMYFYKIFTYIDLVDNYEEVRAWFKNMKLEKIPSLPVEDHSKIHIPLDPRL
jgi:hypothetical protein